MRTCNIVAFHAGLSILCGMIKWCLLLIWSIFADCITGPYPITPGMPSHCYAFDFDHDGDVDLHDVCLWERATSAR